jgi:NAD(P)-dependent dehydrogenase (short-subunit alcohol dehydrogenase family)
MESLSNKRVIVTGGTRGIGLAIAEQLLKSGAAVAICGRTRESVDAALERLTPLGKVYGLPADVTNVDHVAEFFRAVEREFGGLDVLVNNAGAGVFRKVAEMSPEEWRRNIDLDLNAPFYCAHEALKLFQKSGGGYIVNISSLAGKNAFSGGAGYNAAKAGLNLFTEALMLDHRYENIRVTSICPGSVNTEFSGNPAHRSGDTSWMIQPEDVAEAVAFVLQVPARTMISSLDMRPSIPRK